MGSHLAKVAVVADMVTDTVFFDVCVFHWLTTEFFGDLECLKNRTTIVLPTADVVDLAAAWCFNERMNELSDIFTVNVVTNLFSFVTKYAIFAAFQIALHKIAQKSMQLNATVIWPGQAASSQAACGHIEITPIFLHHHVRGNFGCPEERVFRLINTK